MGMITKYATEMGSGAVIYTFQIFINIGSGIPKLIRENTDSMVMS
jgi:hypothetical protein